MIHVCHYLSGTKSFVENMLPPPCSISLSQELLVNNTLSNYNYNEKALAKYVEWLYNKPILNSWFLFSVFVIDYLTHYF